MRRLEIPCANCGEHLGLFAAVEEKGCITQIVMHCRTCAASYTYRLAGVVGYAPTVQLLARLEKEKPLLS